MNEDDVTNAFLNVTKEDLMRPKRWWERSFIEKLLFWKTFKTYWINPEIVDLTMKHPNWLNDCLPEKLK